MGRLDIRLPGELDGRISRKSGRVLDPLIIFAGKNFQSTWKGEEALPNTMYGISSNGWMTTGVFFEWFQKFAEQVEERPHWL